MIIGHLPAGYLFTRAWQKSLRQRTGLVAGLIGAVFPDIDLIWFYWVDQRQVHHHDYWLHRPFFWLCLLAASISLYLLSRRRIPAALPLFFAAVFLHLGLDTIAGSIHWLWPIVDAPVTFVVVPATHSHWLLSFMHHWTFKVEIAVLVVAIGLAGYEVFACSRMRKANGDHA